MTYQPAFDPYGSAYRMLLILSHLQQDESTETDRLRIFDFLLLFPQYAYSVRLQRGEDEFRRLRDRYIGRAPNPYFRPVAPMRLMSRMTPYQSMALNALAARGLIGIDGLRLGLVRVADAAAVDGALVQAGAPSVRESNVAAWLMHCFRTTPMGGKYGLKYRTQLMLYRYDDC